MLGIYVKNVCRCFLVLLAVTLICTIFMRNQDADKLINKEKNELTTNQIKQEAVFTVLIQEDKGRFFATPDELVVLMIGGMLSPARVEKILPKDKTERLEFWKMAAVICRTNLVAYWESQERPENFIFPKDILCMISRENYCKIYETSSIYSFNKNLCLQSANTTSGEPLSMHQEICQAIDDTRGEILTYLGETIEAPYFYLSNGVTRDAQANYPYLKSQICLEDLHNGEQVTRNVYNNEYLKQKGIYVENMEITKDETGYVKTVSFFDDKESRVTVEAVTIQERLGLMSLAFSFEEYEKNQKTAVVTNGIGHGYGVSLNYASFLAQNEYGYDEILKFFYTDVTLTKKW